MKSDLDKLLKRINELLSAAENARGTSQQLVHSAPLEIHLYNIATRLKIELKEFKAMIDDANGTYLKDLH